ncbi:MAG: hypothetical protein WA705_06185 [Candidatus Ozemobacteraceae bacterium]
MPSLLLLIISCWNLPSATFGQSAIPAWTIATVTQTLLPERPSVARSLPTLLTSLPLFSTERGYFPDGSRWERRDRMKPDHSPITSVDRPRGIAVGLYPLFENWYILESIWHDRGSGSSGDHNLLLLDLGKNLVCGGVHQGGTHTRNAEFFWYDRYGLLYLQGFSGLSDDSGMLYRFPTPPVTDKPERLVFQARHPIHSKSVAQPLLTALESVPPIKPAAPLKEQVLPLRTDASPLRCSIREAWKAVFPILKPREPDFSLSKRDFTPSGIIFRFPEQTDGSPGASFTLPWQILFKAFRLSAFDTPSPRPAAWTLSETAPRQRYPRMRHSVDREWTLRDRRNGEGLSPDWQLIDRFNREVPLPQDFSVANMGFAENGVWILANETLYWADGADLRSKRLQRFAFKNVQFVSEVGPNTLLVTCIDALYSVRPRHGRMRLFLRRPHPPDEQSFWVAAWRLGSGDFIMSEQLESLGSGEIGRLLRVRLSVDPFADL